MSATSSQLYLSTRGKAAFDSISILLPSSWSGTDCLNGRPINDKISLDPRQTDFLVTNGHPIFGDQKPITLQYGQCGQTGLGIRIPHQLLSQSQNLTQKTSKIIFFFEMFCNLCGFEFLKIVGDRSKNLLKTDLKADIAANFVSLLLFN